MVTPKLLSYIKTQLDANSSPERIVEALVAQGWLPQDIEEAMKKFPEASRFTNLRSLIPQSASVVENKSITQPAAGELAGIAQLFRETLAVYRKRFVPLALVQGLSVFVALFPVITTYFSSMTGKSETPSQVYSMAPGQLMAVIAYIVPMVVLSVTTLIQFHLIAGHEHRIGVREALYRAIGQLGSYIWLSILFSLVMIGGVVFFIIPALMFALWFAFSFYAMVVDGSRGTGALLRSKYYVDGRTLAVFARLMVLVLTAGAAICTLFIAQIAVMFIFSHVNPKIVTLTQFPTQIVISFIGIFINVYIYTLYMDLRRTKPAPDVSKGGPAWILILIAMIGAVTFMFIGIFVLGILSTFNPAASIQKARDYQTNWELLRVRRELLSWNFEKGSFPAALEELVPTYLPTVPINTQTSQPLFYERLKQGADFRLCDVADGKCVTSTESSVTGLQLPSIPTE